MEDYIGDREKLQQDLDSAFRAYVLDGLEDEEETRRRYLEALRQLSLYILSSELRTF